MLHPLKKKIGDGLWNFVVSLLISFSMSMLWSRTFLSEGHVVSVLFRCALLLCVFAIVDQLPGKIWKPFFYFVIVGTGAGLAFFGIGPVYEMVQGCRALFLQWAFRTGNTAGNAVIYASYYTEDLRNLLCLIICAMVYVQVAEDSFGTCLFMFVVFTALPYLLIQFPNYPVLPFSATEGVRMAAPGAAGLVMMLGTRGGRRAGLLPIAAILTAAALLLAPAEGTMDREMHRMAEQASWYGRDLFFTGEDRSAFSLASTDYMPLKDRLGGSVSRTSDPVMLVTATTRDNVYLKGSSCDTYTGFGWQDTLSERGYLFNSPLNGPSREKTFGKTRKTDLQPVSISVRMLRNGSTTVFSPQRILSFTGGNERMVLYFNQAGELYITRDMEKGDGYTVSCLMPDEENAEKTIYDNSGEKDTQWEQICTDYLKVPESVSPIVSDMTMDIIFGISDPLERAIAIRNFLRNEYPYTLKTGTPDPDEDFVSWFLLKEKKGYCTYFASAMTIMCRIAGIPARYVTGYAFTPSDDGTATVTTGDGHAWTEIYLEGFGWLTMDATGSGDNGNKAPYVGNDSGNKEQWNVETDAPDATETHGRQEEKSEGNTEEPEDKKDQKTPNPTQAPAPTKIPEKGNSIENTSPIPTEISGGHEGENETSSGINAVVLIILLLIAAIGIMFILCRMSMPTFRASRNPNEAARIYYSAAFNICGFKYGKVHPSETWPEYATRIMPENNNIRFMDAAKDYQESFYKKDHIGDAVLAKEFYQEVWAECSVRYKMNFILRNLFKM